MTSIGTSQLVSPFNLFYGLLWWKKQAELVLQRSGLAYTIVRPGGLTASGKVSPATLLDIRACMRPRTAGQSGDKKLKSRISLFNIKLRRFVDCRSGGPDAGVQTTPAPVSEPVSGGLTAVLVWCSAATWCSGRLTPRSGGPSAGPRWQRRAWRRWCCPRQTTRLWRWVNQSINQF